MNFSDICKTRESVRGYKSAPLAVLCCIDLPDEIEPAVLIPIGYSSSEGTREKARKNISEIVETL